MQRYKCMQRTGRGGQAGGAHWSEFVQRQHALAEQQHGTVADRQQLGHYVLNRMHAAAAFAQKLRLTASLADKRRRARALHHLLRAVLSMGLLGLRGPRHRGRRGMWFRGPKHRGRHTML